MNINFLRESKDDRAVIGERRVSLKKAMTFATKSDDFRHHRLFYPLFPIAVALLLTLLSPLVTSHYSLVCGQSESASISGRVTDQSNLVMPEVEVEIKNVDTGLTYNTKTNGDGFYDFPFLPPGNYLMSVRRLQFRTVSVTGITLHVQDSLSRNFVLQVGSSDVSITVTSDQNNINTTDATVATVIDRNFAENLPLNGRSFQTLILLAPGTVPVTTGGNGQGGSNGGTFSVNGQRANANSFTVDGVSANLGGFLSGSNPEQMGGGNPSLTTAGTTQAMVSVDALQEFKIQTSTYAPEFGRQPGGQISLVTRSGTNAFHGTAFDYFRNTVLDANNWFNDRKNLPKAPEHQNDFGGTIGGPIFKDRTFFFFSYEGLRLLQPFTQVDTVPSLCLRGTGPCLPGGKPAGATFQSILSAWALPDGPESTYVDPSTGQTLPTGGAPFTDSQSLPTNLDSYSVKIDHHFGQGFHFFGKYSYTGSNFQHWDASDQTRHNGLTSRGLTIGLDTALRPTLQNELRLNYAVNASTTRYNQNIVGGAKPVDQSVFFPAPLDTRLDNAELVISLPRSFFGLTQGSNGRFSQRQINVIDNISHSYGSHQIRWGVDYRRLFPINEQPPLSALYFVTSVDDLAAGNVSIANTTSAETAHPIYTNFSAYGQDTWAVSKRLSLTYGLRWELNPAPGERDGIQPPNVIGLDNLPTATLAPLNSKLYKTTFNNFAPRIGAALKIRQSSGHELVLRGGFGVFYDLNSETASVGFNQVPFQNNSPNLTSLPNSTLPIPFPVPNNVLPIVPVPVSLTPPFSNIFAIDPKLKLPYTLEWNVSVEQGLGQNQSLSGSYVAAAGRRLLRSVELFDFNHNFLNIVALSNSSSSNYQSLQMQFNRRLSHGLQALASYTYSHAIDNASDGQNVFTSNTGATIPDPNIDRGNSAFDLRHAFRGALTFSIPSWNINRLSKAALGGWVVDAIGIAQTGLPVDLTAGPYTPSAFPDAGFNLRPNVVLGQPLYLYGPQCAAAFRGVPCPGGMGFNPAAFTPVPTDTNGNPTQTEGTLGRNVMRSFGAWQLDFALQRQFDITERIKLQFRSEFFNVFNHPNFGVIQGRLNGGNFGRSVSTLNRSLQGLSPLYQIGGPRSIQLALRLVF